MSSPIIQNCFKKKVSTGKNGIKPKSYNSLNMKSLASKNIIVHHIFSDQSLITNIIILP